MKIERIKIGYTFVLIALLFVTFQVRSQENNKINFDDDWQFVGIALNDSINTNSSALTSLGGKNWDDQFDIKKVNVTDSLIFKKNIPLEPILTNLKSHEWENITLPHTAFLEPVPVKHQKIGFAFYKKEFVLPKNYKGKKVTLEFEGAMQIADVWINGKYIKRHLGGYLPFTIDLTEIGRYGDKNTIFIRLDNRANPQVPPGKPVEEMDFLYYSGIYRDVWLQAVDKLHITDPNVANKTAGGGIFVTYKEVSEESAVVNIKTNIKNEHPNSRSFKVTQQLVDHSGKIVLTNNSEEINLEAKTDVDVNQSLTVDKPQLWSPDNPNLYQLKTIIEKEGKTIDEQNTTIGIRSIYISKEAGLLINGKPVYMRGSNRHMNYPWVGNALSNNANTRDAILIKKASINSIRLAHYPQDPSFYKAADSLGLMLINAVPGWQFFNTSKIFTNQAMDDIRQTIRRDRNHPSVILWEMSLNEAYPPAAFRCMQDSVARSEWIGKENFYTSGDSYFVKACYDVPYDDWNGDPGARSNETYPDNAFLIREYGDYEFGGGESTSRMARADGEQGQLQQAWNLQWAYNKNKRSYPRGIGSLTWAFFDGLAGGIKEVESWGIADLYRLPKFSYYFFSSQKDKQPTLHIANYWTPRENPAKVVVYSNVDSVALYVNKKLISINKPDDGPDSSYGTKWDAGGNPFDGGNSEHLTHAPFTFNKVPYERGVLKAIGYKAGKQVIEKTRNTPGVPYKIKLELATHNIPLALKGSDQVFVYARIMDKDNNLIVKDNKSELYFEIESNVARLAGPKHQKVEAGIAPILLQTEGKAGEIIIKVKGAQLKDDTLHISIDGN